MDILLDHELLIFPGEKCWKKKLFAVETVRDLKMAVVKAYGFVKKYFREPKTLVAAIRKYHEMSKSVISETN